MKKLLFIFSTAFCFIGTNAQSDKTSTKRSEINALSWQATAAARTDSLESARQVAADSMLAAQIRIDSVRKFNDSSADQKFRLERMTWHENKIKKTDSVNKAHIVKLSRERDHSFSVLGERDMLGRSAKLNSYQKQQVNFINGNYFEKAQKIKEDHALTETKIKAELARLNDERIDRLKIVIGKSKERRLEKARNDQKNTNDTEAQWINEAAGIVNNK